MLQDLTPPQRKLADYMSELSEEAYAAGWMKGLEFALWKGMKGELKTYGWLTFSEEMVGKLEKLSGEIKGWIIFDDKREETFSSWKEWEVLRKMKANG